MEVGHRNLDGRLLVLPPTLKDGSVARAVLTQAGVDVELCSGLEQVVLELHRGAAAVLLPEEVVTRVGVALAKVLSRQPPWSDLPILVLTAQGADSIELQEAIPGLGNVTLLERPVRVATLLSAVRSALRARDRQYQIRGHLVERAAAEQSLREADRRKDEFLATLGHELRNPLAPMLTSLHLLKMASHQDPLAIRASAVMERQLNHLIRLVDDLLEVSRITRGVIDVKKEPVELLMVLRAAIETSRPALESAQHTLVTDLPDEPLTVLGDSVRLTQVFSNLLNNAAKYTDPGGWICLAARRDGEQAIIEVRDNGIGIDRTKLATIFEMFTQVDRSNRRAQGGLGLGLTLVRTLVVMHGGSVEAASGGHNSGSTFVVRLPLVAERSIVGSAADVKSMPGLRVLVVDDNPDAAETLGMLLEMLGARVSVAGSGEDALREAARFHPSVVLLDIGMPGMDGYEVARRLRAGDPGHDRLLVALTGWGQEDDVRRSQQAGFDHHLVKPPDVIKLREIVEAYELRHQTAS